MKKQIYAYEGILEVDTNFNVFNFVTKERDPLKKSIEIYATEDVVETADGKLKSIDLELYNVVDFVICNSFPKSDEKQDVYNLFEQLAIDAKKERDYINLLINQLEINSKIIQKKLV